MAKVRVGEEVFDLAEAVLAGPGVEEANGHVIDIREPEANGRRLGLKICNPFRCQAEVRDAAVFPRLFDVVHVKEVGVRIPVAVLGDLADVYRLRAGLQASLEEQMQTRVT